MENELSWNIGGGLLAALGIAIFGFVLAQNTAKRIKKIDKSGIADIYAGIIIRFVISTAGVVGVFLAFGKSIGVPCALGIIPLYIIELVVGSVYLARTRRYLARTRRKNTQESSTRS